MKSVNDLIKSFDYSNAHGEQLQQSLIKELSGLPIIQMKLAKGRSVFRCRKHKSITERFYFESEISYRTDKQNIEHLGRCNYYNSPKFYGSIATGEVDMGYATAIFETSQLLRDGKDGYEIYSVGKWIANEDVELLAIKPAGDNKKDNETYKEIQKVFEEHFEKNVSEDQKEFYELMGKEISKVVKSNENYKYCISALTAEIMLQAQIGIVYPSVQADSKGLNVVFNPANFDKYFSLQRVLVGDFFKFKDESLFRNLYICEDASVYPFKYQDVDSASFMPLTDVIKRFISSGISIDYMMNVMFEQLGK